MISVIVPVYNVEAYLERCVESLSGQTYEELEILLVDDGSTDRSGAICDAWARRDGRIRVIHKENGGLSDARNAGLDAASGEYIGFMDGDDWIEPEMYRELLAALERAGAEAASTGHWRAYAQGYSAARFASGERVLRGDEIVLAYLRQSVVSPAAWDKLYKRELFSERRFPVGRLYEDAPVVFDILCGIDTLAVVGKARYHYFQRADSICGRAFSERRMDHYAFSREIRDRVRAQYPQYSKAADVFWGCKLSELLYSLYESGNQEDFSREEALLRESLAPVWKKVVTCGELPPLPRCKTLLLRLGLEKAYVWGKSVLVRSG